MFTFQDHMFILKDDNISGACGGLCWVCVRVHHTVCQPGQANPGGGEAEDGHVSGHGHAAGAQGGPPTTG